MQSQEIIIPKKEYDLIIDVFMPSADMRAFLKETEQLPERILQLLILGSPISLGLKRETIQKLADMEELEMWVDLEKYRVSYHYILDEIDRALEAYNSPGMFTLEECWYDLDIGEEKNSLCGVFDKAAIARKYIKRSDEEDEYYCGVASGEEPSPTWWTLSKWETQKNDLPKLLYKFYLIGTQLYWFDKEARSSVDREMEIVLRSSQPFLNSTNLWLPVPYKEGDAVEINTYPFGPKQPAFITDIDGDWIDAVVKNHKGEWIEGGIVHGFLGRSIYQNDYVSPLYWIRRWPSDKKINGGKLYV